jgi:hypothetical protein
VAETLLPQLKDPEAREAVADAVMALLNRWGLHEVNQARLLGLTSIVDCKRKIAAADSTSMERAGYLLAIERALLKRFPGQAHKHDEWIFLRHDRLAGLAPLSIMLEKGVPGMILVKKLAESGG